MDELQSVFYIHTMAIYMVGVAKYNNQHLYEDKVINSLFSAVRHVLCNLDAIKL